MAGVGEYSISISQPGSRKFSAAETGGDHASLVSSDARGRGDAGTNSILDVVCTKDLSFQWKRLLADAFHEHGYLPGKYLCRG